jgi:hypothetical protein
MSLHPFDNSMGQIVLARCASISAEQKRVTSVTWGGVTVRKRESRDQRFEYRQQLPVVSNVGRGFGYG